MFHVWAGDVPNISLAISCHIHPSALKHAFASGQHLHVPVIGTWTLSTVCQLCMRHGPCVSYPHAHPLSLMPRVTFFFLTSPSRPIY